MADEALSKVVSRSSPEVELPYTVPAGKRFEGAARYLTGFGGCSIAVDGERIGQFMISADDGASIIEFKPVVADAGQVISVPGADGSFGINGILFDVEGDD